MRGGAGHWRITGQCHKARPGVVDCECKSVFQMVFEASWALWLIPCEKWLEYQSPVWWGCWGTSTRNRRGRWGKGILSRRTQPCTWEEGLATRVWTDVCRLPPVQVPLCSLQPAQLCPAAIRATHPGPASSYVNSSLCIVSLTIHNPQLPCRNLFKRAIHVVRVTSINPWVIYSAYSVNALSQASRNYNVNQSSEVEPRTKDSTVGCPHQHNVDSARGVCLGVR